ncbi:hypothetical protein MLD38_013548 [Melastoma candidum]|uniref:Uncharacterized protein n=1 Tax=Melastoma candidum TaxID=119954 RepID=A0ACB9RD20_9MYRT|nr:hypothetical protein MLD38_013548 [Melastoma candidum]
MGLESSPPPFLSINSTSSLKKYSMIGLNFASGASGILDLTGENVTTNTLKSKKNKNVFSLREQIKQFAAVRGTLPDLMGQAASRNYLANCLFFISTGSNDIFAYYLTRSNVSKNEFISTLGSNYKRHLELLISLGARKIGMNEHASNLLLPVSEGDERDGRMFGWTERTGSHFSLDDPDRRTESVLGTRKSSTQIGNAFNMTMDVLQSPISRESNLSAPTINLRMFNETKAACCGTGKLNAQKMCNTKTSLLRSHKVPVLGFVPPYIGRFRGGGYHSFPRRTSIRLPDQLLPAGCRLITRTETPL